VLVEVEFDFYYGNSWPELVLSGDFVDLTITSNDVTNHVKTLVYKFWTNSEIIIFKNTNKKDDDTIIENNVIVRDQIVKFKNIRIDNILVRAQLLQPYITFLPSYSQGYLDSCDQNNIIPETELHDTEFYFNGVLSFKFRTPFWPWYADLRRKEVLKYFSNKDIELYFGTGNTETQELLQKLKTLVQNHV
jgi:hypothetical protein